MGNFEVYLSMNTKEPSAKDHELAVVKKMMAPGKSFKISYGEAGEKFLKTKR